MHASLSLLVAVALASLSNAAGNTIWAKLSAYLKSPNRPFVLLRPYPGKTEFKCVCQGKGNKIFRELTSKGYPIELDNIRVHLDKRIEACYAHAPTLPPDGSRASLEGELKSQVEDTLEPCLRRLFNFVCCSTPDKVLILTKNEDIYKPIEDTKQNSALASQLSDFEVYCERRKPVTYPAACPAEADQIF